MEQNLGPLCWACSRYTGVAPGKGFACEAYPTGIPVEILASLWDHRDPQDGDGGLRYEPKVAQDWWVMNDTEKRKRFAIRAGHSEDSVRQALKVL